MNKKTNWSEFRRLFASRFKPPFRFPGFVFFFVFIIVLINLVSIFDVIFSSELSFSKPIDELKVSLITKSFCTISLSIITSSCIELILMKDNVDYDKRQRTNFAIFGIVAVIVSFLLLYLCQNLLKTSVWLGFIIGLLNLISSFIFWLIANSDNESLIDRINLNAIVASSDTPVDGGSTPISNPLKGDLKDFKI